MATNLYIIGSPLQLLNAVEARHRFSADKHVLLLRYNRATPRALPQLRNMAALTNWSRIVEAPFPDPWSPTQELLIFGKFVHKRYKTVFIGDYRPFSFRLLGLNLRRENLYLLDDGMFSVTFQETPELLPDWAPQKATPARRIKRFFRQAVGLRFEAEKPVNLFTAFSLKNHPGQEIIRNDYAYLRGLILKEHLQTDAARTWFLGQPLSELGMVEEGSFLNALQIAARNADGKLTYIAHRVDSEAKLARIVQMGIEVTAFDHAVEVAFYRKGIYPAKVTGFTSTALITLRQIYPQTQVQAYELEASSITAPHRERFAELYAFMRREKLPIISLAPRSADN